MSYTAQECRINILPNPLKKMACDKYGLETRIL